MYVVYLLDEKPGMTENKASKSETPAVEQSEEARVSSIPGAGFPGNPFDFSAMSGLLNVHLSPVLGSRSLYLSFSCAVSFKFLRNVPLCFVTNNLFR